MCPKTENEDISLIAILNVVSGAVLWSQGQFYGLRAISEQSQSKEHKSIAPIAIEASA